jgi:nicotinamide riboside kinase
MLKKVVILGPESTGKSTLCTRLAAHYQTSWVPEYAREYLTTHGPTYNYESLLDIAKGQINLEEEHISAATNPKPSTTNNLQPPTSNLQPPTPLLFIDTEMYVMKVWCEFVYGKCHQWIIDRIVERSYDLFLLCNTDLPWAPDVLREYPEEAPRQQLFRMYHDILINQPVPWTVISGSYDQRLQSSINAVSTIL